MKDGPSKQLAISFTGCKLPRVMRAPQAMQAADLDLQAGRGDR
jgi:hypothetical protein